MDELESTRPADEDRCGGRNTMTRQASGDSCTSLEGAQCWAGRRTGSRCVGHIRVEIVKHRSTSGPTTGFLVERRAYVCDKCGQAYGRA